MNHYSYFILSNHPWNELFDP